MKTIVLANLKQVFETIMTLCNILQLRVTSYNEKTVMYIDVFDGNKVILLNKEYCEVFYHDYTNDIHVRYEINNSDKLFAYWYDKYDELKQENTELYNEVDYLNVRIENMKKEYRVLDNCYAEKCRDYENLFDEKTDMEKDINDFCDYISKLDTENDTLEEKIKELNKEIIEKENLINSLYNQISTVQLTKNNEIEKIKQENQEIFESFMREYNSHTETIKANEQLKIDIASYKQQIEEMTKQNNFLHKKIRKMNK